MSIYVAIACLGIDEELPKTINSCISQAENPNEVIVGVSMIGEIEFYNNTRNQFINNKNIKIIFNEYKDNIGVGIGRRLALSQYNNEDYVMQIDAHSRMSKGWDKYLINKFNTAKQNFNNKKIILTGTPARYYYDKNEDGTFTEKFFEQYLAVNLWREKEHYRHGGIIPTWGHTNGLFSNPVLSDIIKTTGFAPAAKICAAFIFSDKNFTINTFLSDDMLFWEEEIVQSIEFLNDGYTLVFPGADPVISHLYTGDITYPPLGERYDLHSVCRMLSIDVNIIDKKITDNYLNYMSNPINRKKIKFFERYNKFSFKRVIHDLQTHPYQYANINKNPI